MSSKRTHRFFVSEDTQLKKDFWLHDEALLWQWNKVLRFGVGQQVILFDGLQTDRLYEIVAISKSEAHLRLITELERVLPKRHVYVFWSLLKRDNNEHILQKATEIGVSNFVPIISDRTIKKDFNHDRASKIVREAAEQCGRSDIPFVREPVHLAKVLPEYVDKMALYVCEKGEPDPEEGQTVYPEKLGIFIGPEGGWSDAELELFNEFKCPSIHLGDFTFRAETAVITASYKVLQ